MEWTNWKDFHEKYTPFNEWEAQASWNSYGRSIEGLADLWRKNLIDIEFLDQEMITDIASWWLKFGRLERENWERGFPAWSGHFPFIKEVLEYLVKTRPWLFDEAGNPVIELRPDQILVDPEEIMKVREQLLNSRQS
jgi:hypothetical protein